MSIARKKILMATEMQKGSIAFAQAAEVQKSLKKANPLAVFQRQVSVKPKPVVKQRLTEERKFKLLLDVQFMGSIAQLLEHRWRNHLFDSAMSPALNKCSSDVFRSIKNLKEQMGKQFNVKDQDELEFDATPALDRVVAYFCTKPTDFTNTIMDRMEAMDREIETGVPANLDKGYFLYKTQANKPKNKLQEEISNMTDVLSRKLISETSVIIQQIKDNIENLNTKYPRCQPLRLDLTEINNGDISLQIKTDKDVLTTLICYKVL